MGTHLAFQVYNIIDWANDGGAKLKDKMRGCGAMTGWDWSDNGIKKKGLVRVACHHRGKLRRTCHRVSWRTAASMRQLGNR
jgi:hypothetical protein